MGSCCAVAQCQKCPHEEHLGTKFYPSVCGGMGFDVIVCRMHGDIRRAEDLGKYPDGGPIVGCSGGQCESIPKCKCNHSPATISNK